MKKLLLLVLVLVFVNSNAQDKNRPWAIGVGINGIDLTHYGIDNVGQQFKDYITVNDLNVIPVLSRIYVAKYIGKGFSLDLAGSINKIDKGAHYEPLEEKTYYSLDLGVRYDVNNLIGETGWFDPYVKFAAGTAWLDGNALAALSPGLGFNTWFNDKIGLNFETAYKSSAIFKNDGDSDLVYAFDIKNYHFQHSISLVYKFGAKDADKDGVPDKEDLCPEIAGSKEFFGCPDTDGDGIVDKDDSCPELAGTAKTKGCPDSDGDGVADKDDACPQLAGKATLKGCPDTDGDGVADKDDACPGTAGAIDGGGCPDSDGDGVADKDDNCPNEVGLTSNNGCPENLSLDSEGVTKVKGDLIKTVEFNFGTYTFKAGVAKRLDEVIAQLNESDIIGLFVEGHSDSTGPAAYNVKLSQQRADAVADYFISKGIEKSRLVIMGYGETKPLESNNTSKGRAENRRVEISILELKK
ncbi:OmpA family protein [Wenyingzhuangia sp. 2_MG-2023]|uniref:OmpA family protein n=1 Tax=Wenyingzhuangia sp. 2_MG-2023 TaxID=3062639 RepID=UPI0026E44B10|nr:OmpA family protein [Wenyingzhuangia sp. 2_MG-2023]MDO6736488.1 OmpA family protein [Wenyingzhuangia sp. 2_MG-2023]